MSTRESVVQEPYGTGLGTTFVHCVANYGKLYCVTFQGVEAVKVACVVSRGGGATSGASYRQTWVKGQERTITADCAIRSALALLKGRGMTLTEPPRGDSPSEPR
jgi:hypothetical protein